jgi:hypothetical protein
VRDAGAPRQIDARAGSGDVKLAAR